MKRRKWSQKWDEDTDRTLLCPPQPHAQNSRNKVKWSFFLTIYFRLNKIKTIMKVKETHNMFGPNKITLRFLSS